ncbi:MAG: hypothetical protein AAGK79_15990 [Pseudomonadota bacterium]
MRPRLIRASFFLWIIAPLALFGAYQAFGLPHMIWSYTYRDDGQGADPFAYRFYYTCRYVGPYGEFERHARNGKCGWVRFFKENEGAKT